MKKQWICFVAALIACSALADTKPFNMSVTPDMAIYRRTTTIEGVTLSVWGENPQSSLALGIANGSTGKSAGLDAALLLNYAEYYNGVKFAPLNYTRHDFIGWDSGFINWVDRSATGLSTGMMNFTHQLKGVQFGFINYVDETHAGFQIGLINIIRSNQNWFSDLPTGFAPVMIFVNWGM